MSDDIDPVKWAAQLETMRDIGLSLDAAGRFHHRGDLVTHQRLRVALLGWLGKLDDGRDVIRLDAARYAYVDIEDTHLRALHAVWRDSRCIVTWDDEHEEELDYASLLLRTDNALQVRVRGELTGKIGGSAFYQVTEQLVETDAGIALNAAGKQWLLSEH